jgi:transposase InsO family protein
VYPTVRQPFGRVHIDLTGELPTTDGNGSKYIMVVKDFHTKFVWLFALKSKDAVAVADQLVTELYCRWGIPEMLVSDRGSEYRNKLAKRIHHIFRVNKIATTPYSPRSNGFVENHNRTMKDQLHHFVNMKQKDWDIFLPTVQLMYNTTVNSATGYTPYYLMFGRECNLPNIGGLINRQHEQLVAEEGSPNLGRVEKSVYEEWEEGLVRSLELAWQYTSERAHRNVDRGNRTGQSSGLPFREYQAGDHCYRKRNRVRVFKSIQEKETNKINVKLQARYEGPYKIIRKVNAVVYEVDVEGVVKRVHATNMKPGARAPPTRRSTQSEQVTQGTQVNLRTEPH